MPDLDPILEGRLDLLEQALDEVEKIKQVMGEQRRALERIDRFLRHGGEIDSSRKKLMILLGDAATRLEQLTDDADGPEFDDEEDAENPWTFVDQARQVVKDLGPLRTAVNQTFVDVKRWSVAELAEEQLAVAAGQYRELVKSIRRDPEPWKAYEQQLRGRGDELFTAYLDLLSSMAIRGFGVDTEIGKDRDVLLALLLEPKGYMRELPHFPVPNLLTRTKHIQLGYTGWSLWALPLLARDAALDLIDHERPIFRTVIPARFRLLCADVFASYTLGPSYAAAAIYLDLDPDGTTKDGVSDPERAQVMLDILPSLGSEVQQPALARRADQLRDGWAKARAAVSAEKVEVPAGGREVANLFLAELRSDFDHLRYDLMRLMTPEHWASLLAGEAPLPSGVLDIRDLLIAMWVARLDHPDNCRTIHEHALGLTARVGSETGAGANRQRVRQLSRDRRFP